MIKILTIIGARPQIIKSAALSRAIRNKFNSQIKEVIVHTGQHYDANMSQVFFDELQISLPDYNLNVGSESHGKQTAAMLTGIEDILLIEKPHAIVLYGDTNSTLSGCIAASKIHIPIIHIEAGLRSFNKSMPEEINRIVCDHLSTFLFSPTHLGLNNLILEGFKLDSKAPYCADNPKIYHCGDIMYDNSMYFSDMADNQSKIIQKLKLKKNKFILVTIHRNNNTDEPERLNSLFQALNDISLIYKIDIAMPLHPRTDKLLKSNLTKTLLQAIKSNENFKITKPVSYLEMIALEKNCQLVMTDSGGIQKEAYYFEKPCVILRKETEWKELIDCGAAIIADANIDKIKSAYKSLIFKSNLKYPKLYGNGKAAEFICAEIIKHL